MALGPFTKQDHVQITTLGLEFAASEILGAYAGYWLDKRLDSSPWFLIAGVVLGFMLGFYQIVRSAKQMEKDAANLKKADKKDGRS